MGPHAAPSRAPFLPIAVVFAPFHRTTAAICRALVPPSHRFQAPRSLHPRAFHQHLRLFVGTHHHDCHYLRLQRENRQAHQRRRPLARSGVRLLCELHPLLLQHVLAAVCLHRRDFLHHPAGQSLRNHRHEKRGHEFPTFAPAFLHGGGHYFRHLLCFGCLHHPPSKACRKP